MKLTYLGTAAAEGFPAVFCNCQYCQEARKLGGKNIRTRSQAIINDDLLIDLCPDTYHHFLVNNIESHKIKYLVITHAHGDHLYPVELCNRQKPYAHGMEAPTLEVYGSALSIERATQICGAPKNVSFNVIDRFQRFELGEYTLWSLPARHMDQKNAFFYVIKQGEKTLLYGHDTGFFYDEVFDFFKNEGFKFDLVSLDCTNGDIAISDTSSHMGFENNKRLLERLESIGCIGPATKKIINHFSHNANPIHEHFTKRAASFGCDVSYDSMTVEI
ncbi:MAG: hypothetical protein E7646_09005 [Ruminococcaceae bacterium]|nr:hypothetical protein [Oscillospiraceae bacterium]